MMEVELKAPAPKGIEKRLAALGARRLSTKTIRDDYYDLPGAPLRRKKMTLRLRTEGKRLLLTFKSPRPARGVKAMEETELPATPALRALLEGLGYAVTLVMRKRRAAYRLGTVTVCLDNVAGLGRWAEFEAFGKPTEARKRILAAAARLGIPSGSLTTKAYPPLLRERLKKGKR